MKLDRNINGKKYVVDRILDREGVPRKAILVLPGKDWLDVDSDPQQIIDPPSTMKAGDEIMVGGHGKYGLINNRLLSEIVEAGKVVAGTPAGEVRPECQVAYNRARDVLTAISMLEELGILDWGPAGTESEFFVMKLRDRYAGAGLRGYMDAVQYLGGDREYFDDLRTLEQHAGQNSPFCKKPD